MTPSKLANQWQQEYNKKGIPSSFKADPSKSALIFFEYLQNQQLPKGPLLDIGCGKGRNGLYFAEKGFDVTFIDLVSENIAQLQSLSQTAYCCDLAEKWPLASSMYPYAIDIFCFKHLIANAARSNYRRELVRCLAPKGLYMLSLASIEDGFYGPLLETSPGPIPGSIIDPFTQIGSILYTQQEIEAFFAADFLLVSVQEKRNRGPMHGHDYDRCLFNFIFQKL